MTEHEVFHRMSRAALDLQALRAQLCDRETPCEATVQGLRLRLWEDLEALREVLRPAPDESKAEGAP